MAQPEESCTALNTAPMDATTATPNSDPLASQPEKNGSVDASSEQNNRPTSPPPIHPEPTSKSPTEDINDPRIEHFKKRWKKRKLSPSPPRSEDAAEEAEPEAKKAAIVTPSNLIKEKFPDLWARLISTEKGLVNFEEGLRPTGQTWHYCSAKIEDVVYCGEGVRKRQAFLAMNEKIARKLVGESEGSLFTTAPSSVTSTPEKELQSSHQLGKEEEGSSSPVKELEEKKAKTVFQELYEMCDAKNDPDWMPRFAFEELTPPGTRFRDQKFKCTLRISGNEFVDEDPAKTKRDLKVATSIQALKGVFGMSEADVSELSTFPETEKGERGKMTPLALIRDKFPPLWLRLKQEKGLLKYAEGFVPTGQTLYFCTAEIDGVVYQGEGRRRNHAHHGMLMKIIENLIPESGRPPLASPPPYHMDWQEGEEEEKTPDSQDRDEDAEEGSTPAGQKTQTVFQKLYEECEAQNDPEWMPLFSFEEITHPNTFYKDKRFKCTLKVADKEFRDLDFNKTKRDQKLATSIRALKDVFGLSQEEVDRLDTSPPEGRNRDGNRQGQDTRISPMNVIRDKFPDLHKRIKEEEGFVKVVEGLFPHGETEYYSIAKIDGVEYRGEGRRKAFAHDEMVKKIVESLIPESERPPMSLHPLEHRKLKNLESEGEASSLEKPRTVFQKLYEVSKAKNDLQWMPMFTFAELTPCGTHPTDKKFLCTLRIAEKEWTDQDPEKKNRDKKVATSRMALKEAFGLTEEEISELETGFPERTKRHRAGGKKHKKAADRPADPVTPEEAGRMIQEKNLMGGPGHNQVSLLNNLCQLVKLKADLRIEILNQGGVPWFKAIFEVKGQNFQGFGSSKMNAKVAAACLAIKEVFKVDPPEVQKESSCLAREPSKMPGDKAKARNPPVEMRPPTQILHDVWTKQFGTLDKTKRIVYIEKETTMVGDTNKRSYTAACKCGDKVEFVGTGNSKKMAKNQAARKALLELFNMDTPDPANPVSPWKHPRLAANPPSQASVDDLPSLDEKMDAEEAAEPGVPKDQTQNSDEFTGPRVPAGVQKDPPSSVEEEMKPQEKPGSQVETRTNPTTVVEPFGDLLTEYVVKKPAKGSESGSEAKAEGNMPATENMSEESVEQSGDKAGTGTDMEGEENGVKKRKEDGGGIKPQTMW